MPSDRTEDRMLDSFQQWQLGIFLLVVVVFAAAVAASALQALGVPYPDVIGGLGGAVAAFLAISYWYYGR